MRAAAALAAALLLACACGDPADPTPTQAPAPALCDAGDAAFVERALPLMWGRRPHGAAEIEDWARAAADHGRETALAAMARDPAFAARWRSFILDALRAPRTGDRDHPSCYATPLLEDDHGALARHIAEGPADGAPWPEPFNMADVIRSALAADDLSVPWRVHLFARMARPVTGANVGAHELENNRRIAFGDELFQAYLGRDLTCLPCHNSELSTTDSADPATDRHWPVPGLYEAALLGSSLGRDRASAYAVFRYADLLRAPTSTEHPWGMADACGRFTPAAALGDDLLSQPGYFIEDLGEHGSVWQVEAALAEGLARLRAEGLTLGESGEVDGPMAFAWLVAQSIVGQVWEEAAGAPLTIATGFPRNQAQRDILMELTARFVASGYSLVDLLIAVATHPTFNHGPPGACGAQPYGLQPIFNPWSIAEEAPARRMNGAGDQVHRRAARSIIRGAHDALGWAQPADFLAQRDPMLALQTALGAFMRSSQPGWDGTDFQGVLAFEATYGACARPDVGGAGDGCFETPGHAGCASCRCQDCVCAAEPYCCDVQWDAQCVALCEEGCGGCGGGLASGELDAVDRLLAAARERGATVGDLTRALKDRLSARGTLDEAERAQVEALLGVDLDTPVAEAGELEPALRRLCGALLISPEVLLSLYGGPPGPVPTLALDADADCARARGLLEAEGAALDCGEDQP